MEYYVRADDRRLIFKNKKEAEDLAYTILGENEVNYLEYGCIDYDNWKGDLTLVVLKPYEIEREYSDGIIVD